MPKKYYGYDDAEAAKDELRQQIRVGGWDIIKGVACLTAGGCASMMVGRYLNAALPESRNLLEKTITVAGVYFVTGFVGHQVETYVGNELEHLKATLDSSAEAVKKAKEAANDDRS